MRVIFIATHGKRLFVEPRHVAAGARAIPIRWIGGRSKQVEPFYAKILPPYLRKSNSLEAFGNGSN